MSQLVGYARTPTAGQSPASQLDALKTAGCAMSGTDAQTLARKALIEMGDDWTKRGAPATGDAAEALS